MYQFIIYEIVFFNLCTVKIDFNNYERFKRFNHPEIIQFQIH